MKVVHKIYKHFTQNLTTRKVMGIVLGIMIMGTAAAGLAYSLMGNDPFTAMNMAISDGLGMGLGTFQLIVNVALLSIQLIWGRNYIGLGSIGNMCITGYVIQFAGYGMRYLFGDPAQFSFIQRLLIMIVSLIVLSFGVSMYQTASLGVSPYDFMALGMTDHFPTPYFINRVATDGTCVVVILAAVFSGFISWENSHLGIGTICAAFLLGPFINLFDKWNKRWIH